MLATSVPPCMHARDCCTANQQVVSELCAYSSLRVIPVLSPLFPAHLGSAQLMQVLQGLQLFFSGTGAGAHSSSISNGRSDDRPGPGSAGAAHCSLRVCWPLAWEATLDRTATGWSSLLQTPAHGMLSTCCSGSGGAHKTAEGDTLHVMPAFPLAFHTHSLEKVCVHCIKQVCALRLWPTRPQLVVKHAVPAAFSMLNDAKGESKTVGSVSGA
jgi:hypothetical protein